MNTDPVRSSHLCSSVFICGSRLLLARALPSRPRDGSAFADGRRACRDATGADSTDSPLHLIDDLAQHTRRIGEHLPLAWGQVQVDLLSHSTTAHDCRHRKAYIADPVKPRLQRADRQDLSLIARQRLHHLADRQADGETGTALEL